MVADGQTGVAAEAAPDTKPKKKRKPAKRRVAVARCPNPLHRESRVTANGTRGVGARKVRQYRCEPLVGGAHTFLVTVADNRPVGWQQLPHCPIHAGGVVVRNGIYGKGAARRQRYRCTPPDGDQHSFTPPLPREHIHPKSKPCKVCDERRGTHRGETAAARRHTWSTRVLASGLQLIALGRPYGEVGKWALEQKKLSPSVARRKTGRHEEEEFLDALTGQMVMGKEIVVRRRRSAGSVESRRAWRIAANWVDAFAPVIWAPKEKELRDAAMLERARLDADRAAGKPLDRPQFWIVDDVPLWGADEDGRRREGGFHVLAVAETVYGDPVGHATGERAQIRLLRAMAKSNTPAWRLVFDELGYAPDFIMADAASGIGSAVKAHFDPARTLFIPSLWHVHFSLIRALKIEARANQVPRVLAHLGLLARDSKALATPAAWACWWNDLRDMAVAYNLPADALKEQRRRYEPPIAAAIPFFRAHPKLPLSSGGLEVLNHTVSRVLLHRRQFANIERTNSLFDLVVANAHGAFSDLQEVAGLLREDAESADGWTIDLRRNDDRQPEWGARYSSLRDPLLISALAEARGLA